MKLTILLKWGMVILLTMAFIGGWITTRGAWAQTGTSHVAVDGSDITGNGSDAQPFATIQHGIDAASEGDTVLVHPGLYRENINFNGKNITVGSLFVTTGDEDHILQTVIDGNRNGHVVTFASGEAATAQLSGFTITNGYAHAATAPASDGGGVFCSNYSNPTLTHLRVTGNEAVEEGGGLYFGICSPTIRDVIVTNNRAGSSGGAIRHSYGSVNLENVVVAHNSAGLGGGGILFYHAEGTIRNALIADNSGGDKGGGVHFDGCSPTLINVTLVGNRTSGRGGGLNVSYMSQPTLVNSIVWANWPEQILFDTDWPGEAVTIEYSDIQGGEAGIVTNGHGPVYWGQGNLEVSPRFVHAGLGNYRLADTSPTIGAGKADGAPSTDIEGDPRPNPTGSNPDMGAFEHPLGAPVTPSIFKVYLPFALKTTPFSSEVTLWHGWTGAEADTLAEVISAFQDANPGVTVDTLAVPFDRLKNKFTTEASTGGGPDLLIGPKDWIGELAQAGLIMPLDDLSSKIGLDELNKSAVDANKFQGKVWAFPESTEAVALWYNKDLVKEAPKSETELLRQATEVGLAYNSGFYHSAGILLAEGGRVFDDQQKCALGQGDSVVNGLTFLKDAKGTANVIMDSDYDNLDAAFKDGKVGFIFNGPWGTGDYVKALGADKLGIVDPIAVGAGTFAPFLGTKNLFLSANSKGGPALDFLRFMAEPTTQAMLTKVGHIPSNPNVKVDDPIIAAFLKQTASAGYFPNEPEMGAVWTPATDMIIKVIEGTLGPADAVKEACTTIDKANGK